MDTAYMGKDAYLRAFATARANICPNGGGYLPPIDAEGRVMRYDPSMGADEVQVEGAEVGG